MKFQTKTIPLILLTVIHLGAAEDKKYFTRGGVAFEIGIWKPIEIDAHPSKPFTGITGADPMVGISLISPMLWGFALQLSALQWHQGGLEQSEWESVLLRHIALDIKHQLVSQSRISPYVAYGATFIWAGQKSAAATQVPADFAYAGIGANICAGVDFALFRNWGVAAEYQYIYAEFDRKIGLTANYSGPKLAAKLLITF